MTVENLELSTSDEKPVKVRVMRTFRSQTASAYIDDARVVVLISHHLGASTEPFATRFRDLKEIVESWRVEND